MARLWGLSIEARTLPEALTACAMITLWVLARAVIRPLPSAQSPPATTKPALLSCLVLARPLRLLQVHLATAFTGSADPCKRRRPPLVLAPFYLTAAPIVKDCLGRQQARTPLKLLQAVLLLTLVVPPEDSIPFPSLHIQSRLNLLPRRNRLLSLVQPTRCLQLMPKWTVAQP